VKLRQKKYRAASCTCSFKVDKASGKKTADGIEVSLSREELAQLTGTTLFTISRILSRWADMGVVIPRREAVLVRDPERLEFVGNEID
jgi:CRP-like cAMP-binding protein